MAYDSKGRRTGAKSRDMVIKGIHRKCYQLKTGVEPVTWASHSVEPNNNDGARGGPTIV